MSIEHKNRFNLPHLNLHLKWFPINSLVIFRLTLFNCCGS